MSLRDVQHWFQERVTHPAGVDPTGVDAWVLPSATLTAAESMEIYNRSYHARLLDGFRSFFPALLHALGDDVFDHFAVAYLQTHPPSSFTISRIADAFPQWLAETRPAGEAWPDFLIELATLELAFHDLYESPAPEERRFAFRYPVHEYQTAVRRGGKPEPPEERECVVTMRRARLRVVMRAHFLKKNDR